MTADSPDFLEAQTLGNRPPKSTALHLAAKGDYRYNVDVLQALTTKRGNVNAQDARGMTPIMHCVGTASSAACVRLLLEAEADLELKNVDNRSALDLVSKTGAPQSLRRLLEDATRRKGDWSLDSTAQRRVGVSDARQQRYEDRRGEISWSSPSWWS